MVDAFFMFIFMIIMSKTIFSFPIGCLRIILTYGEIILIHLKTKSNAKQWHKRYLSQICKVERSHLFEQNYEIVKG